jgi:AcrR family transcriptional regulator
VSTATSLDPRVRRTRRLLQEAVLSLAEERDVASITIQDITRRAEVNRATFYLHYRDKDDLVAQALDALFDEFTAEGRAFVDAHGRLAPDVVPPPLVDLFRHVGERPNLYRRLLGSTGASAFAARLRVFEEQQFLRVWREMGLMAAPGSPPAELRARFAIAALQGTVSWWLERGRQESPETMAAWLWHLLSPLAFGPTTTVAECPTPSADGQDRSTRLLAAPGD